MKCVGTFNEVKKTSVQSWLFRLVEQACVNQIRLKRRKAKQLGRVPESFNSIWPIRPNAEAIEKLECLTPTERSILIDRFVHKMSAQKLADKYNISKTSMQRTIKRLVKKVKDDNS